jgi:hypothetical protein
MEKRPSSRLLSMFVQTNVTRGIRTPAELFLARVYTTLNISSKKEEKKIQKLAPFYGWKNFSGRADDGQIGKGGGTIFLCHGWIR